jgi:hypothetical protein
MIEKNLEVAADSYTKIIDRANANRVRLQRAARIEAEFPGLSQGAVDELRGSIMGALPSEEFHAEVAALVQIQDAKEEVGRLKDGSVADKATVEAEAAAAAVEAAGPIEGLPEGAGAVEKPIV